MTHRLSIDDQVMFNANRRSLSESLLKTRSRRASTSSSQIRQCVSRVARLPVCRSCTARTRPAPPVTKTVPPPQADASACRHHPVAEPCPLDQIDGTECEHKTSRTTLPNIVATATCGKLRINPLPSAGAINVLKMAVAMAVIWRPQGYADLQARQLRDLSDRRQPRARRVLISCDSDS